MEDNTIWLNWYIARYKGEQALTVKALMNAGIPYILRSEKGSNKMNYMIEVAFRQRFDGPVPEYVVPATPQQAKILDGLHKRQHGIRTEPERVVSSSDTTSNELVAVMRNSGLRVAYDKVLAKRNTE